jgi:hypothetical protein
VRPRGWLLLAPNGGNYGRLEYTWRGPELIVGNYYVLTLLVFIAATACALVLTCRQRPSAGARRFDRAAVREDLNKPELSRGGIEEDR